VLDILAYDHVLFIIVLTIIYNFNQWKKVVWLITFFTIGHSITLGLAAFDLLNIPLEIVEFLIPVTICTTGFFNLLKTSSPTDRKQKTLLFFALFFGLIHGLGFSNYFRLLIGKEDDKILPLIEFAIGIEAAQIIIVLGILILGMILQNIFRVSKRDWVLVGSSIVVGIAFPMIIERIFW
jgi:hydrogenase/urease accessory protein HupE